MRPIDQMRYNGLRDTLCTLLGEDRLQAVIQEQQVYLRQQREEQLGSGKVARAGV